MFLTSFFYSSSPSASERKNRKNGKPFPHEDDLDHGGGYRETSLQPDKRPDEYLAEIERDLAGRSLMSRLVQGDVGSGKTIIAFLAMILAGGKRLSVRAHGADRSPGKAALRGFSESGERAGADESGPCFLPAPPPRRKNGKYTGRSKAGPRTSLSGPTP